jgi:hypothetical protein
MKSWARVILALTLSAVCCGALLAADFEKGFLDKPWGAPLSEFPGYVSVGGSGKIAYYINPKQAYTIFDTQLSDLVYGFYNEKFFAVYAALDAIDKYAAIKHQIQQRLGVPRISMESRGSLTTYSWKTGETRIKMKYHDGSGAMKLSFYYLPMANQVNAELQKEMDEEPPQPLFPLSNARQKEAVEQLDLFDHSTY